MCKLLNSRFPCFVCNFIIFRGERNENDLNMNMNAARLLEVYFVSLFVVVVLGYEISIAYIIIAAS